MTEEVCSCGHHHDHEHHHEHHHHIQSPQELRALKQRKQQLGRLQENMKAIQTLHDKIDNTLAKVTKENAGIILTQKKTLKELKKLADMALGQGKEPIFASLYKTEQEYIESIEDIMHHAQLLKRAGQGNVTKEVIENLKAHLTAGEKE